MKLSKRQFNKMVGQGWDCLMPEPVERSSVSRISQKYKKQLIINVAGILAFIGLYFSLLFGQFPSPPYDSENIHTEMIFETISEIYNSEVNS